MCVSWDWSSVSLSVGIGSRKIYQDAPFYHIIKEKQIKISY